MTTILDIIQSEAVDRYGPYTGEREIDEKDPIMCGYKIRNKHLEPDYIIHCSKYILEGIYQAVLSKGIQLVTYISEEEFSFSTPPPKYLAYQFPKMGVVHFYPDLSQGYIIQKNHYDDEEYRIEEIQSNIVHAMLWSSSEDKKGN